MPFTVTYILFILILFQLLFLSLFLFIQKQKNTGNTILGFFFLCICFNLLDVFFLDTGLYFIYPKLAGWGSCLPLLFGPLLYFYTKAVVDKSFRLTVNTFWHFLPFIIFFAGTEVYYLSRSRDMQEGILHNLYNHHVPGAVSIVTTVIFIQFILYAVFSLRLVSSYKRSAQQLFSNPKSTDVSWLYSTLIFFILIMVITALNGLLAQTSWAKYYLFAFNLVILAVLIFVIQVLMRALRQSYFFFFDEQRISARRINTNKTGVSEAEKQEKEKIIQAVLRFMQSDKPYLEPELSLDQLAARLSLKPRVLSQAINDIRQQNFFDFINRYRVEEASRLLINPADKKITVLEVLYQAGFNSKSSFNTLFKRYTGLTPTEFRQKQID